MRKSKLDEIPTSYGECVRYLSWPLKESRPCGNNTTVVYDHYRSSTYGEPVFGVVLHSTQVVTFYGPKNSYKIHFATGGWNTVTTRDRINRVARAHGWSVYSDRRTLKLRDFLTGRTVDFPDRVWIYSRPSHWNGEEWAIDPTKGRDGLPLFEVVGTVSRGA